MCLIAVASSKRFLDSGKLYQALSGNQDGFGFMAEVDGELVAERYPGAEVRGHKEYANLFREKLDEWIEKSGGQIAVHLRQRTSGPCDEKTAHPFPLNTDDFSGYFMHNGVFQVTHLQYIAEDLDVAYPEDNTLSDTAVMVEILERANLPIEEMEKLLVQVVSANPFNRLVTWNSSDKFPKIYNMDSGETHADGRLWYSNNWYFL